MLTNPRQNRIEVDHILLEQFRRKGYRCEEVKEKDVTVIIITHERKNTEIIPAMSETYKDLPRTN